MTAASAPESGQAQALAAPTIERRTDRVSKITGESASGFSWVGS